MPVYRQYNNIEWLRSYEQRTQNIILLSDKANVKVFVAGHYAVVRFYGRPVSLPGCIAPNSLLKRQNSITAFEMGAFDETDERQVGEANPGSCIKSSPSRSAVQNRQRHVKKSRSKMMLLINANFDPRTAQFVTLTFESAVTELAVVKQESQKFFKRLRKNVPCVKYICVPERTDDHGWHLHLIVDRELPMTEGEASAFIASGVIRGKKGAWNGLWKRGLVYQKKLDGGGNLGASIAKYMSKGSTDPAFAGSHIIWRSDNLERPTELSGADAVCYVKWLSEDGHVPIHSYYCDNIEFIETLTVFEFCTDRRAALYDKCWWLMKSAA